MEKFSHLEQALAQKRMERRALFGLGKPKEEKPLYPEQGAKLPDMKDLYKAPDHTEHLPKNDNPEFGKENKTHVQPSFSTGHGLGAGNGAVNPDGSHAKITDKIKED